MLGSRLPVTTDAALVDLVPAVVEGDAYGFGSSGTTNTVAQAPYKYLTNGEGICR